MVHTGGRMSHALAVASTPLCTFGWTHCGLVAVAYANTSAHGSTLPCCLGDTEAVEPVGFTVVFLSQPEELLPGKDHFESGQSLFGLVTAAISVLGVLVSTEAVDRAGLVLAFKLCVGTG